jgi:adenylate cyclase class 2
MIEREIKLRVDDLPALRAQLLTLGWTIERGPYLESNILYDTLELTLKRQDKLLRVRNVPGKTVLTVKGPAQDAGLHKAREEHEVEMAAAVDLTPILRAIGLAPAWRYDKRRTRYAKPGEPGVIELDETPIGSIVELEGDAEWIDRMAAALGYGASDYITASYRELFVQVRGEDGGDMVFETIPTEPQP